MRSSSPSMFGLSAQRIPCLHDCTFFNDSHWSWAASASPGCSSVQLAIRAPLLVLKTKILVQSHCKQGTKINKDWQRLTKLQTVPVRLWEVNPVSCAALQDGSKTKARRKSAFTDVANGHFNCTEIREMNKPCIWPSKNRCPGGRN